MVIAMIVLIMFIYLFKLKETNPFYAGDSADQSLKVKLDNFLKKIDEVIINCLIIIYTVFFFQ